MKRNLTTYLLVVIGLISYSQDINSEMFEGSVSYITSQNVYVKFSSTKHLSKGDTLFYSNNGETIPALLVSNLSSISAVCTPLEGFVLRLNDTVLSKQKRRETKYEIKEQNEISVIAPVIEKVQKDTVKDKSKDSGKIRGKISVSSYSNFSNTPGNNSQRMRYTLSLNANNISDSRFSVESYLSFVHSNINWDEVKKDLFNGLKIYNLALKYESKNNLRVWFGRRINPSLSNIGAIDGLQIDKQFKSISLGGFVGSRPDYRNYGYDFKLFQFGAYIGHNYIGTNGNMQTTLSFVNQENNWNTDRRFIYIQHYNYLVKNLYFIGTAELELYQNINGNVSSNVNITNLYLLLRYRPIRKLSISMSYRSQSNLIYYETYKDYVQQLIDDKNIRGFRLQVNYRPVKYLTIGAKAGYRSRDDDPLPSKNFYAYLSYSRIPAVDMSATLSFTMLESSYLKGRVYSLRLSKDLIAGKLYGGVSYRYVDYDYMLYESSLVQHIGDINLNWRIIPKLSLMVAYEGVFESKYQYNRLYVNVIKRF